MSVSVIIPTLNEAKHIGECIRRVHAALGYAEIIVVDNGSVDGTASLAADAGAHTYHVPGSSISRLRNFGAAHSAGDVLVFLDADVMLLSPYGAAFDEVLRRIDVDHRGVYGANYGLRRTATWVERLAFDPDMVKVRHIPAGNMIMARAFFDELGGFDEQLQTGEDCDICGRARDAGALVEDVRGLATEHLGYPRTLWQFIRREAWLGRGDYASIGAALQSRVFAVAMVFLLLHLIVATGWLLGPVVSIAGAAAVAVLVAVVVFAKAGPRPLRDLPGLAVVWYAYLWGRVWAMWGAQPPKARTGVAAPGAVDEWQGAESSETAYAGSADA